VQAYATQHAGIIAQFDPPSAIASMRAIGDTNFDLFAKPQEFHGLNQGNYCRQRCRTRF
jgi:hypothetical protein